MKTQIKHFAIVSLSLVIFTSCTSFNKKKELVQVKDSEIFLMTYNLENLFDTKDDEGKNDEEFLPRSIKNTTYYQNLCFTRTRTFSGPSLEVSPPGQPKGRFVTSGRTRGSLEGDLFPGPAHPLGGAGRLGLFTYLP